MSDEKPAVLTDEEIGIVLQRLPGWQLERGQLAKEFLFKDFIDSLSFVNRLVPFFDRLACEKKLVLLEGAGHFPLEAPALAQLRDAVRAFLESVSWSVCCSPPSDAFRDF